VATSAAVYVFLLSIKTHCKTSAMPDSVRVIIVYRYSAVCWFTGAYVCGAHTAAVVILQLWGMWGSDCSIQTRRWVLFYHSQVKCTEISELQTRRPNAVAPLKIDLKAPYRLVTRLCRDCQHILTGTLSEPNQKRFGSHSPSISDLLSNL
jgi:hypothetical protein